MRKALFFLSLSAAILAAVNATHVIVYLNEDPLVESKAFKGIHKEVMKKRSTEGNVPLSVAISRNRELRLQDMKIKSQQNEFISAIPQTWKIAEVPRENGKTQMAVTRIASNSVVVDIGTSNPKDAVRQLMLMPGVKRVEEERKIKFNTYQSLDQIRATPVYEALGLEELDIGKGIKIAVIDSGNIANTSMMHDEGFSLPTDIPADRGELSNVNNKLIISRKYGSFEHSYQEIDGFCHGLHTSSIVGGRRVNVSLYGHNRTLSGVAPGAWLMNYRYVGATDAFLNVVADDLFGDNPHISSNSWGPLYPIYNSKNGDYSHFDRTMDNGIFTTLAIDNQGPQLLSAGASVEKTVVAGACTKDDIMYYNLTVPAMEKTYQCISSKQVLGVGESYNLVVLGDNVNSGCDSSLTLNFPENSAVLLMKTADCEYYGMAENSKKYGASLMVVGEPSHFDYSTTTLSSIHCVDSDLAELIEYVSTHGSTPMQLKHIREDENTADRVAFFSSRGPTQDMRLVPDVVAPGVYILAAGYADGEDPRFGFNYLKGTSMSSPAVSGAAAVILQKHPEFTVEELKSALMTTADYINITKEENGEPAQPLDMGAGRINLEKAIDPTLYISPPKVDFSLAQKPNKVTKALNIHSYSDEELTVSVRIVLHSGVNEVTPAGSHLSAEPSEFTLNANKKDASVTIAIDTNTAELGDHNAYVLFENKNTGKEIAHVPLWGQVICPASEKKDVLLYVVDKNTCDETVTNSVVDVYKNALAATGLTYDVFEYCNPESDLVLLQKALGLGYKTVILALNSNVKKDVFSPMESNIRRMMHAGVTIVQMGSTLPSAWASGIFAFNLEFGIDSAMNWNDVATANSDHLVAGAKITNEALFRVDIPEMSFSNLYETKDGKPIIVAVKDIYAGYEEGKTLNSATITSFVGLEQFKEEYRKDVLLKMFGNGMERRSDINTVSAIADNVASFNVSSSFANSKVSAIEFNCGGNSSTTKATGDKFACTYSAAGDYEVSYLVYTDLENTYYFTKTVTVETIPDSSSSSEKSYASYALPSFLMMVLLAVLLMA